MGTVPYCIIWYGTCGFNLGRNCINVQDVAKRYGVLHAVIGGMVRVVRNGWVGQVWYNRWDGAGTFVAKIPIVLAEVEGHLGGGGVFVNVRCGFACVVGKCAR